MAAEKIVYSDANTVGANTPLFSFDTIFDTDFGMLVYIRKNYFDTSIFSEEFFKKNDKVEDMVKALYSRKNENPLLMAMNDNTNYDLANELYLEFYTKKYKEILTHSMPTNIADMIEIIATQSGFNVGVLISRPEEYYFLDAIDLYSKLNYIDISKDEDISRIDMYNQFYFKSCNDPYITDERILKRLRVKNIYLPRYPFNLDDESKLFLTGSVIQLELNHCEFYTYDMYTFEDENNEEESAE